MPTIKGSECGQKMQVWMENASVDGKCECAQKLLGVLSMSMSVLALSVHC